MLVNLTDVLTNEGRTQELTVSYEADSFALSPFLSMTILYHIFAKFQLLISNSPPLWRFFIA